MKWNHSIPRTVRAKATETNTTAVQVAWLEPDGTRMESNDTITAKGLKELEGFLASLHQRENKRKRSAAKRAASR